MCPHLTCRQARALALLKKAGPLKKTNPNAVRSRPSEQRKEAVKKRLEREADENCPGVSAPHGAGEDAIRERGNSLYTIYSCDVPI